MGDSPIYHLPWPELSDPADVPAAMQDTAMATDGILNTFHTETQADLDSMQDQITGATGSMAQIGHVSLAATAALLEFTSIPQTYRHLMLLATLRQDYTAVSMGALKINGGAAGHYGMGTYANAATTSVGADINTAYGSLGYLPGNTAPAEQFGRVAVWLPDYAKTDGPSGWLSLQFGAQGLTAALMYASARGGTYNVNGAITRLGLLSPGANLVAKSKATLYGLKGA